LKNRATAAKKSELTQAENTEIAKLAANIKAQEVKIAKLEKALGDSNNGFTKSQAQKAFTQMRRTKSRGRASRNRAAARKELDKLGYC